MLLLMLKAALRYRRPTIRHLVSHRRASLKLCLQHLPTLLGVTRRRVRLAVGDSRLLPGGTATGGGCAVAPVAAIAVAFHVGGGAAATTGVVGTANGSCGAAVVVGGTQTPASVANGADARQSRRAPTQSTACWWHSPAARAPSPRPARCATASRSSSRPGAQPSARPRESAAHLEAVHCRACSVGLLAQDGT
jgi:hypothetical protein